MNVNRVDDQVFASEALGKGVAIMPEKGVVVAPEDCTVSLIYPTRHALGLTLDNGAELLIHIGMNTVELNGQYFTQHVEAGTRVTKGTPIVSFDLAAIEAAGYDLAVPVILANTEDFSCVTIQEGIEADENTPVIFLRK
jgi:PTS system beta-glucosides-specific IIC component